MTNTAKKSSTRDTVESLVVTVILALFGTTFIVQTFKIPTGSMETTLLIGDHLLVNKLCFAYHSGRWGGLLPYREVRRGDIIVFRFPPSDENLEPGEHLVKRVVGVPGDRIRIKNRQVFVNGSPVADPHVHHADPPDQPRPGDDFPPADSESLPQQLSRWNREMPNYVKDGELVVPDGSYFAMGDNRERSWDSRFWGFVPRGLISGRPLVIYWSFETPPDEYQRTQLGDRAGQVLDLVLHFFTKTRWRRTFALVR